MAAIVEYSRLTGGHNSADDPSFIGDSQMQLAQNVRPVAAGRLKSRGGTTNLNSEESLDYYRSGDNRIVNAIAAVKDSDATNNVSKSLIIGVISGRVRISNIGDKAGASPGYRNDITTGTDGTVNDVLVAPASTQGTVPLASICECQDLAPALQGLISDFNMREIIVAANRNDTDVYGGAGWRRHPAVIIEAPRSGSYAAACRKWGINAPSNSYFTVQMNTGGAIPFVATVCGRAEIACAEYLKCSKPLKGAFEDIITPNAVFKDKNNVGRWWVMNFTKKCHAYVTSVDGDKLYHDQMIDDETGAPVSSFSWSHNDIFYVSQVYSYVYFYRRAISVNGPVELKKYNSATGMETTTAGNYLPNINKAYKILVDSPPNNIPQSYCYPTENGYCGVRATVYYSYDPQVTHICLARRDPGATYFQVVAWAENDYTQGGSTTTIDDNFGSLSSSSNIIPLDILEYGEYGFQRAEKCDCYSGNILRIYGHSVIKYPTTGGGFNIVTGNPYYRNRWWWTQGGTPKNHHIFFENDFCDLPDNGDTIVAQCVMGGVHYIFQQRHTWAVRYNAIFDEKNPDANRVYIPIKDGISLVSSEYGCMSPRGVAVYEGIMFVMTHKGVMVFDGTSYRDPPVSRSIDDETLGIDNLTNSQIVCTGNTIYVVTEALRAARKIAVGKIINFDDGGISWSIDLTNNLDIQAICPLVPAGENIYYKSDETGIERNDTRMVIAGYHGGQNTSLYAAIYDDPAINADFNFYNASSTNIQVKLKLKRLGAMKQRLNPRHVYIFAEVLDPDELLYIELWGDINRIYELKSCKANIHRSVSGEPYQNRYPSGSLISLPAGGIDGGVFGSELNANTLLPDFTSAVYDYGFDSSAAGFWDTVLRYAGASPIILNRVAIKFNVREVN